MILREAKLDDFEIFKSLYEDEDNTYQILYISSKKEDSANTTDYSNFLDESIAELYSNYTIERFEKDLESSLLLYMIEDSSEIIGYISMFYCGHNKYKIAELAMFNPADDSKKVEVLNCLKKLKLPRLRKLSICTVNDEVVNFLTSNGFYSTGTASLYRLDIV